MATQHSIDGIKIHNFIKLKYSNLGYLPGSPYYLISDAEMFDAFLREDGFFADEYPCPCDDLEEPYNALLDCIKDKISAFMNDEIELPDWVYSYMIMRPITYNSDEADIAYLVEMGNVDMEGILAEFTPNVARTCYYVSKRWLAKQPSKYKDRVPTMFGETHVTKSLRLDQANILVESEE